MADWTSTASVLIAAGGLAYTGSQFQLLTRDRKKERQLGIDGVCVSWLPEHNPRPDGQVRMRGVRRRSLEVLR